MEEDFYSPSLMSALLSSGMQGLPTAQPVRAIPYFEDTPLRPRDMVAADTMMSPRDIAAVPTANAGVVSPFTTNPYMVVNYGKETNVPSFENTQNLDPTKTYTLTNPATGEVMAQSDPNDPTSLARLVQDANQMSGYSATRANWELSQDGNLVASDYPNQSLLNAALPYLGAAIAAMGLAPFLGIGVPAASGAAGGAGAGAAGTAAGTAAAAGTGAAGAAGAAGVAGLAPLVGPGWTVLAPAATGLTTTGAVLGGSTLAGALAAAANAPGATSYADQVFNQSSGQPAGEANLSYVDPVTGDIIVPAGTANFPIDPNSILAGFLGSQFLPINSVNVPPTAGTEFPEIPQEEIPEGTGPDIVVEGDQVPRPGGGVLPVVIPPLSITSVPIPPGAGTTLPPANQSSLLDDILKYYSLGSGLLDMLGVGQGGNAGTAAPYTSVLGAAPNFGRGPFTPFTGDYERYAFGPEWNFFGGAPASTPTNG